MCDEVVRHDVVVERLNGQSFMSFMKLLFFSSQAYTSCDGRPDYGIVYSAQIIVVLHKGNNSSALFSAATRPSCPPPPAQQRILL